MLQRSHIEAVRDAMVVQAQAGRGASFFDLTVAVLFVAEALIDLREQFQGVKKEGS